MDTTTNTTTTTTPAAPATRRTSVARAALQEVGRPDLADQIGQNRAGHPTARGGIWGDRAEADATLILRAIRLGHRSDPEGAPVGCGVEGGVPECDTGSCDTCLV